MSDDSGECSDELDLRPSGSKHRMHNTSKRRILMRVDFDSDSSDNCSEDKPIYDIEEQDTKQPKQNIGNVSYKEDQAITQRQRYPRRSINIANMAVSDDSSSDNETILCPGRKVRSKFMKSVLKTDNETDGGDIENKGNKCVMISENENENDVASDSSSNELLEKCPICLLTFRDQEIGSPSICQHIFCADCIESWSKNVQTCPIDRIVFSRIIVRGSYKNRRIIREINVKTTECNGKERAFQGLENLETEEETTNCEICQRADREDVMLLCDNCDQGYHMDCLNPPLSVIPLGSWYCDSCEDSPTESNDEDVAAELDLLVEDIRDMGIPETMLQIREINQPRILRTRQNERIRAAVLRQTRNSTRLQTHSVTDETGQRMTRQNIRGNITNLVRKPRKRYRRRRRRTAKRTYVVEYDLNNFDEKFAIKTTKKVIRRRRKRRKVQRAPKLEPLVQNRARMSASKRLAEQMGVKKDPTYTSRLSGTGTALSLFGSANDLEYFSDSDNGDGGVADEIHINAGEGMTVQTAVRLSNYNPCRMRKGGVMLRRLKPNNTPSQPLLTSSSTTNSTNFDILSGIMDLQNRWINAIRNFDSVRINPDGSLHLPNSSTPDKAPMDGNKKEGNTAKSPPEINQIPLYSRGGGANNFNSGGYGGYQNNYNQNYRRGGGGAGVGSGGGGNQHRHSTGGNMNFNMLGQTNNYNTSNNPNYGNTNPNPPSMFSPFPLRFNQRNQVNQRNNINNNNNANNYNRNSAPFLNNRNDNNNSFSNMPPHNLSSPLQHARTPHPTSSSSSSSPFAHQNQFQMNQSLNIENNNSLFAGLPPPIRSQPPPITPLRNVAPPGLQQQQRHQLTPIQNPNISMDSNSLFSGLPPPICSQMPPTPTPAPCLPSIRLPTPLLLNVPPPPTPPTAVNLNFSSCTANTSFFQLNTSYMHNDDDSNCPNFAVYSQESQEVAKSSDNQPMTKTATVNAVKEDDDNEDLVQLDDDDDDDDEIPMPPEPKSNSNANNVSSTTITDVATASMPVSELYEPENPTEEMEEDNDDEPQNMNDTIENDADKYRANDKEQDYEEDDDVNDRDVIINKADDAEDLENETVNKSVDKKDHNDDDEDDDSSSTSSKSSIPNADNSTLKMESKKSQDVRTEKVITSSPRETQLLDMRVVESEVSNRRGVLDLYDDSDWDEIQIERPKGFTPIGLPLKEGASGDGDGDGGGGGESGDAKSDGNTPQHSEIIDHEKITEQDRSYTPCLDENNDLDDTENVVAVVPLQEVVKDAGNTPPKVINKKNHSNEKRNVEHMETELISEEEYDNVASERDKHYNKNASKRSGMVDKHSKGSVEPFKKVSGKQKERNYRGEKQQSNKRSGKRRKFSRTPEKSHSRSRSHSRHRRERSRACRSRSPRKRTIKGRSRSRSIMNKENRSRLGAGGRKGKKRDDREGGARFDRNQKRNKRRELPRYDVRNVVNQNTAPKITKDRYGRDTSRTRKNNPSLSRERRYRPSFSRSRSRSRTRSRSRRHSFSPPGRRNRRLSLSMSGSPRPFLHFSITPPFRRFSPSSRRFSPSPRRSLSPVGRRSPYHQRSRSPLRLIRSRSLSSRGDSRHHIAGPRKLLKRMREKSPIFVPHKDIEQNRTPSISPHYTPQLSRSPTKSPRTKIKKKKSKESRKKKTKRGLLSVSPSPLRRLMRQPDTFAELEKPLRKKDRHRSRSPRTQQTLNEHELEREWSPSPSPPPEHNTDYIYPTEKNISWTPPMDLPHLELNEPSTKKLYHEDGVSRSLSRTSHKEKNKRPKKKKKGEKRRDVRKEKKRKRRTETPEPVPSKEVFASGNNILVSVSFNKDAAAMQPQPMPQQQTIVTVPPNREDLLPNRRISIDRLTNSSNNTKKRKEKRKKLEAKPVAIIDLERSPFHVQQEPMDVIILTDSEDNHNELQHDDHHDRCRSESCPKEMNESHRSQLQRSDTPIEHLSAIHEEESYDIAPAQMGPKTPPEPPLVKFNLQPKKPNKVRNPLHEEDDEDEDEDEDTNDDVDLDDHQQQQSTQQQLQQQEQHRQDMDMTHIMSPNSQKIGPNTPPETGPYSPDAYDPFEPTKSPSMSPRFPTPPPPPSTISDVGPSQLCDNNSLIEMNALPKHIGLMDDAHREQIPALGGNTSGQGTSMNPVDLVMALMNSKAAGCSSQELANKSDSQYNSNMSSSLNQHDDNNIRDKSDEINSITVLSNVLISTNSMQHIPSISSPTPPNISKKILPLPKLGGSVGGSSSSGANVRNGMAQNADDSFNMNDIDSPYSPGSADYEDLFEPPPDNSGMNKRRTSKRNVSVGGKPEMFDNLFGSSSPIGHIRMSSYTPSKRQKIANAPSSRKSKIKVGKSNDDLIKVYDDVPNSAVELQVKDRFLRKLNRQERVVEEVKLVLKPRFNKKQITKEDYKEIMRRAVPKICHSKSGEIDPHKIKNLIEAYVKKFRAKHKKLNLANTGQVSSAVKCAAYLKKL